MAKMMMGQIDHARSRVRAIRTKLIGGAPDTQKTFCVSDLVTGLRNGKVSFTGAQLQKFTQQWADEYASSLNSYNRTSFENVLLENAFTPQRAAEKARWEAEHKIHQARLNKVNAEATTVEDAIVLGDNAAALAALTAFANFKL